MPKAQHSIEVSRVHQVDAGYGFSIVNEHRAPVVTFVYPSEEDAEEARDLIDQAVAKADSVVTAGARRAES